jgi:hypothetical protein
MLPNIAHKLRFFDEIQCQLLDYFVEELKAQKTSMAQLFGKFDYVQCCKLLNSAAYCKDILSEWGEDLVRMNPLCFCFLFCFVYFKIVLPDLSFLVFLGNLGCDPQNKERK